MGLDSIVFVGAAEGAIVAEFETRASPTHGAMPPVEVARAAPPRVASQPPSVMPLATPVSRSGAKTTSLWGDDLAGVKPVARDLTTPIVAPLLSTEEKRLALSAMDANEVSICPKCRLCETRTHTVFGEGDVDAQIFFIGEGPGENEDQQGRPFVDRAGQLLDTMIGGMGLNREQVFIANIVKCRPPGNREPMPDEVATCTPYLERQLEIVRPRVIVTLGKPAAHHMLQTKLPISKLRGLWHSWHGIKLMPTFHPAYVLRNYTQETRAAVWNDLKLVLTELGLATPERKKNV